MAVPVSRSVPAKEANSMLLALWSLCVVLTAAMTNTFIRITKGQQNTSRIIDANVTEKLIMKYSSSWNRWQYSLGSGTVEFVTSKEVFWYIDMVFGICEAECCNLPSKERLTYCHANRRCWSSTDGLKECTAWNQGFVIFNNINVTEKVPPEIKYNNDVERGTKTLTPWCMHGQRIWIYFKLQ